MAVSSFTVWELRDNGNETNSGGFDTGSGYFSTNLTAINATSTSPTVSSATYNFVSSDIGKWLYIKSSGVWNGGWYLITSISGTSAVINASIGAYVSTPSTGIVPSLVTGCATTASPTTGIWAIDHSQSSTAKATMTDLVIDSVSSNIISSATYSFTQADIGNYIRITAGTNFTPNHYSIIAVNSGKATLDTAVGTVSATGGTGYLGGAISTYYCVPAFFGNIMFVKNGTYYSNGNFANGSRFAFTGYNIIRGDNPQGNDRPLFRATANNITIINFANAGISFSASSIRMDGSGFTGCTGYSVNNSRNGNIVDSKASNCNIGFLAGNTLGTFNCEADTCTTGFSVTHGTYCVAKNCTTGFVRGRGGLISHCIAANCGTGFSVSNTNLSHCTTYNCTTAVNFTEGGNGLFNCLLVNSTNGMIDGGNTHIKGSYGFGITSSNPSTNNYNFINLSANPFVDPNNYNFTLNNVPGGGLTVKNSGQPRLYSGLPSINYADAGSVESSDVINYINPEISIMVKAGTTSRTEYIYLNTTGYVYNTVGLSASYVREGGTRTNIPLVSQTVNGAYTSGGFVEVDSVNMPGLYRIDVPNALFASGVKTAAFEIINSNTNDRHLITYNFTPTMQIDMTQSVPLSNTANTIGDALNAMRAVGFGKWVISGTNLSLYAPDNVTVVKSFTLNSSTAPTSRS